MNPDDRAKAAKAPEPKPKKWAGKLLHVGPQGALLALKEHRKAEDAECWCEPQLVQPCLACLAKFQLDPKVELDSSECKACDGQSMVAAYDESKPVVVVHRVEN